MQPQEPTPVKLVCAVLYSDAVRLAAARDRLEKEFGHIEWTSPEFPFDITEYYVPEMGAPIYRLFYATAGTQLLIFQVSFYACPIYSLIDLS